MIDEAACMPRRFDHQTSNESLKDLSIPDSVVRRFKTRFGFNADKF